MVILNPKFLASGAFALCLAGFGMAAAQAPEVVPGQILVRFKPGQSSFADATRAAIRGTLSGPISPLGVEAINLPRGMTIDQGLRYYRSLSSVQYAEANVVQHADATVTDPSFNRQWALPKVSAPAAWDLTFGSTAVKIAIVDTGVDYRHEDLSGKVILGKDIVNDDADPMDDNEHGTHCAGIAAAQTNNGKGIAGLGYNCQIIAVKVLDKDGVGNTDLTAKGIINAADLGAQVISLSLGGAGETQTQKDAIAYAANKGIVIIAAAGNDNTQNKHYPGANPLTICVASTTTTDAKSDFSTFGIDWVDVAAPGSDILSTVPGNKYALLSGTSMATPLVAGLAGLLKSYSPAATSAEIRNAIESTTDPTTGAKFSAFGRINAIKAINKLSKPFTIVNNVTTGQTFRETPTAVLQGRPALGGIADLRTIDGRFFSIESVKLPNVGEIAAGVFTADFQGDLTHYVDGNLVLTHQSANIVTTTIYLKNYDLDRWDVLKSTPGSATTTSVTIPLPRNMAPYIKSGKVGFIVRAFVSSTGRPTSTFSLKLDRILFNGNFRS